MEEHILICEDSLEGIFTAIYCAYERHYRPGNTRLQTTKDGDMRLFADYEEITPDEKKVCKVSRTLQREFGTEGYLRLCRAIAAADSEKATAVYRTIALGLTLKPAFTVWSRQADMAVRKVWDLSRTVWREAEHLCGFVRFRELKSGILYAEIKPKHDVLVFLAEHFSDRFPMERFVIRDMGRNLILVHEKGKPCIFARNMEVRGEWLAESENENDYQELFRHFHHTIAIKERINEKLQRNMLPLRFRPYMTEWKG